MAKQSGEGKSEAAATVKPDPQEAAKAERKRLTDPENHVKCVYVDRDGVEYSARIHPVPTNKGTSVKIPSVVDPSKEFAAIATLPLEKQLEAVTALHKRMEQPSEALIIYGETKRLMRYKDILCWTTEINGKLVPCCDLSVEFSKKEGQSNIKHLSRIVPKDYVGTPAAGEKGRCHFYIP